MKTRNNQSSPAYLSSKQQVSTGYPQSGKSAPVSRRPAFGIGLAAATTAALFAVPTMSTAATQLTCEGTVTVVPILSSFDVRQDGTQTVLSFDFIGTHPLCFPDGSQVTAMIAGHMVQ